MATFLERGRRIPLDFTPGTVLVLKPTSGTTRIAKPAFFDLDLYNEKSDILLHIRFCRTRITFNCYARRSLGNGFGKAQFVDMNSVNLKGQLVDMVTVSIHHYLTDSEFGRYQILFDGTTIFHFDKCLPGPATQIGYDTPYPAGPSCWDVEVYQIDELLPGDRAALFPGR